MSQIRTCSNCQDTISEDSKFCSSCGEKYVKPKVSKKPKSSSSNSKSSSSNSSTISTQIIAVGLVALLLGYAIGSVIADDSDVVALQLEEINALTDDFDKLWLDYVEAEDLIDVIITENDILTQEKSTLDSKVVTLDAEVVELKQQISGLDDNIASLTSEKLSLEEKESELNVEITNLKNTVDANDETISSLNNEAAGLRNRINALDQEIAGFDASKAALQSSLDEKEKDIADLLLLLNGKNTVNLYNTERASPGAGQCRTAKIYDQMSKIPFNEDTILSGTNLSDWSGQIEIGITSHDGSTLYLLHTTNSGVFESFDIKTTNAVVIIPYSPDAKTGDDKIWLCDRDNNGFDITWTIVFRFV